MLKLGFNLVPNSIKALHHPPRDSTYNSQTANIPTNQNKPVYSHMISDKLPETEEGGERWAGLEYLFWEQHDAFTHVVLDLYLQMNLNMCRDISTQ